MRFLGPPWKASSFEKNAIGLGWLLGQHITGSVLTIPQVRKSKRSRIRPSRLSAHLLERTVHPPCHKLHSVINIEDLNLQSDTDKRDL